MRSYVSWSTGVFVLAICLSSAQAQPQSIALEQADLTADDRLGLSGGCAKIARSGLSDGGLGTDMCFVPVINAAVQPFPIIVASSTPQNFADGGTGIPCENCFAPYVRSFIPGAPGCAPGSPYGLRGLWEREGTQYSFALVGESIPSSSFGTSMDMRVTSSQAYLLVGEPGAEVSGARCATCPSTLPQVSGKIRIFDAVLGTELETALTDHSEYHCGEVDDALGWRPELYCFDDDSTPVNDGFGTVVRWAHQDDGVQYFITFAPNGTNITQDLSIGRFYVAKFDPSAAVGNRVTTQYVRYGGAANTIPGTPALTGADWVVEDFDGDGTYEVVILQRGGGGQRTLFVSQYDPTEPTLGVPCSTTGSVFENPEVYASDSVSLNLYPPRGNAATPTPLSITLDGPELTTFNMPGEKAGLSAGGGAAIRKVGDVDCDGREDFVVGLDKLVETGAGDRYYVVGAVLSYDPSTATGSGFEGKVALAIPLDRPGLEQYDNVDVFRIGTQRTVSDRLPAHVSRGIGDLAIHEVVMGFGSNDPALFDPDLDSAIGIRYSSTGLPDKFIYIDAAVFDARDGHMILETVHENESSSTLPLSTNDFVRKIGWGVALGDMNGDTFVDYLISDASRTVEDICDPTGSTINQGRLYVIYGCPADYNGDGAVNFFDFSAFQTDFEEMRPSTDLDGDCLFTTFDFLKFQNIFEDGCP